jgi:hypothetical protein
MKEKQELTHLKRVRFFAGQLLSAKDFQAEQEYWLEKQRRHNRAVHGYGVVSGLNVSVADNAISVSPGMAFDRWGNELVLPQCLRLSVAQPARVAYVIARYHERETDSVPVQRDPAREAEFSRVEEGSEITIEAMPAIQTRTRQPKNRDEPQSEEGILLARLIKRGARWQIDRKFRPRKTR